MLATNQSCLLVRTLFRFAGFHRQPSLGLLRDLLYLEVCKSRRLRNNDFPKVVVIYFCSFALFLGGQIIFCVLSYWFLEVTVTAYRNTGLTFPCKSSTCANLLRARRRLLRRLGLLVSEHWCPETSSAVVRPANTCTKTICFSDTYSI